MLKLCWALFRLCRAIVIWLAGLPARAGAELGAPTAGRTGRPKRLWISLAVALPAASLAGWGMQQITLVMSPSIDAWAVRAAPGFIRKGDLVQFSLSHPITGPKPVNVTKYALCMPGERLTMIETPSAGVVNSFDGHYFCDGKLLGVSLPTDAHGTRLAHLRWSGIIPPGMAYVGSNHPRGFDSRYIGLVPLAHLQRMTRIF